MIVKGKFMTSFVIFRVKTETMISHFTKPDRDKQNMGKLQERKLKILEADLGKYEGG